MMETGMMIKLMEQDSLYLKMVKNIKENGKKIKDVDKDILIK